MSGTACAKALRQECAGWKRGTTTSAGASVLRKQGGPTGGSGSPASPDTDTRIERLHSDVPADTLPCPQQGTKSLRARYSVGTPATPPFLPLTHASRQSTSTHTARVRTHTHTRLPQPRAPPWTLLPSFLTLPFPSWKFLRLPSPWVGGSSEPRDGETAAWGSTEDRCAGLGAASECGKGAA